jgi:hypothetical protein
MDDDSKLPCETCMIQGYSSHLCKLHRKNHKGDCQQSSDSNWKSMAKPALIGAGVGVTGTFAGLAVLPALGLKALLGHAIALKITGAGGACGAGTNTFLSKQRQKKSENLTTHNNNRAALRPTKIRGVKHV